MTSFTAPLILAGGLMLGALASPSAAQAPLPTPWSSPRASVSQTIGISNVTLDYSRPGVKGRAVWGGQVPWDEVWRAGANENTTFTLSHDATIEGQPLAAGTYGVHMIPRAESVTVIFSRNATSWGSYRYDPAEDALRVEVKPVTAPHQEWLAFEFEELTSNSALCRLRWEARAVPFRIGFDTHSIVLANARDAYLRDRNGFSWQAWSNAARYCLQNNVNLAEALSWAERSVSMNENFTNRTLQAALLEKLGRGAEAATAREQAWPLATESELNTHGYQMLQAGQVDAALAAFERNTEQHPQSWNTWDSLAETLALKGDTTRARKLYTKALALGPDAENRARIEGVLAKLAGR
ncbi:MAG: DUF2911 domain-containing protein [Planctomycetota bacterium]